MAPLCGQLACLLGAFLAVSGAPVQLVKENCPSSPEQSSFTDPSDEGSSVQELEELGQISFNLLQLNPVVPSILQTMASSPSVLASADSAQVSFSSSRASCEDWCSKDYCDWDNGATCGKCDFCLASCEEWCSKDFCNDWKDDCGKCDFCHTVAPEPPTAPPTSPPSIVGTSCEDWCIKDFCNDWKDDCGKCDFCSTTEPPTGPPTPSPPPMSGTSCDARYLRLENQLSNQRVWQVPESDPQFPSDMRAIAEPDGICGDAAKGIKNSCSKYNKWKTFQQVAKVSSSQAVKVIGPTGVQYNDVGQGDVGTCYFLATLASIAYNQPKIIEDMFPAAFQDLYEQNIYTTRWWLNGKEHLIRVDNQVPAGDNFVPFFTRLSLTQEFWPLILEKTWAKMFGDYNSQEGGRFEEVMLAITRAPTRTFKDIKTDTENLWAAMVGAAAQAAPQAAWCKAGKYGLSGGHVYAILTAKWRMSGRAVKVYNPWRSDYYEGSLSAKDGAEGNGTFWMTFEEFQQAFEWYWISAVITDYKTMGYQAVPGNKAMTVSMTVSSEKKFIVCLNWPQDRILAGATCKDYFFCQATMTVCKDNGAGGCADGSVVTGTDMDGAEGYLLTATIASGSGTYIAKITSNYDSAFAFIKELSVTVYSDSTGGAVPMTATTR